MGLTQGSADAAPWATFWRPYRAGDLAFEPVRHSNSWPSLWRFSHRPRLRGEGEDLESDRNPGFRWRSTLIGIQSRIERSKCVSSRRSVSFFVEAVNSVENGGAPAPGGWTEGPT